LSFLASVIFFFSMVAMKRSSLFLFRYVCFPFSFEPFYVLFRLSTKFKREIVSPFSGSGSRSYVFTASVCDREEETGSIKSFFMSSSKWVICGEIFIFLREAFAKIVGVVAKTKDSHGFTLLP